MECVPSAATSTSPVALRPSSKIAVTRFLLDGNAFAVAEHFLPQTPEATFLQISARYGIRSLSNLIDQGLHTEIGEFFARIVVRHAVHLSANAGDFFAKPRLLRTFTPFDQREIPAPAGRSSDAIVNLNLVSCF